jgi:hypothetical protein
MIIFLRCLSVKTIRSDWVHDKQKVEKKQRIYLSDKLSKKKTKRHHSSNSRNVFKTKGWSYLGRHQL